MNRYNIYRRNIINLFEVYNDGFEPPLWSGEKLAKDLLQEYPRQSKVYADAGVGQTDYQQIINLLTQREPVNMGMRRMYNAALMEKHFGWKYGYYNTHFYHTESIPKNIAVYNYTPFQGMDTDVFLHVINCIGYAFDSEAQVDYRYFIEARRQHLLPQLYEKIFKKIFICAEEHGLDTVVMSLVGGGNFSRLYKDCDGAGTMHFLRQIWIPAFLKIREKYKIKVLFMGISAGATDILSYYGISVNDIGYFPDNIVKIKDLNKTLFVNAWDPLSIAGNGNDCDNSLDGYFGRNTMIGLLSWPLTNPYLLENQMVLIK